MMLKFAILLLLFCLAKAYPSDEGDCCYYDSDCSCNECCFVYYGVVVSKKSEPNERRIAGPWGPQRGNCMRYAGYGDQCSYEYSCGCAPGLECRYQEYNTYPDNENDTNYDQNYYGDYICTDPTYY